MMPVRTEDLKIDQGSGYERHWPVLDGDEDDPEPIADLTGWTARGKVRSTGGVELHEWVSGTDAMELDPVAKLLWIRVPAATSSAWPVDSRAWATRPRYDVELVPPAPFEPVRFLQGRVIVSPEQTY